MALTNIFFVLKSLWNSAQALKSGLHRNYYDRLDAKERKAKDYGIVRPILCICVDLSAALEIYFYGNVFLLLTGS